jgi:hypothetical protein
MHEESGIGNRHFAMSKSLDNEKPEIAKCDFANLSQPLNKARDEDR